MSPQFIIDEKGIVEQITTCSLRRRLSSTLPDKELAEFAVRNLGCVALSAGPNVARVWLRAQLVSPQAAAAAIFWLADQTCDRYVLSHLQADWQNQVLGDRNEAMRALTILALSPRGRSSDFLRQRRSLNSLAAESPWRLLLSVWQSSEQNTQIDHLAPILDGPLTGRFVVVDASDREVLVRGIGPKMLLGDEGWRRTSLGGRLKDMYDFDYGRWSAQPYHEAQRCREPMLEDIDVITNFAGRPRSRYRYQRIILPVVDQNGSPALLGASVFDDAINLRSESS
jgi:hypothetical protein